MTVSSPVQDSAKSLRAEQVAVYMRENLFLKIALQRPPAA